MKDTLMVVMMGNQWDRYWVQLMAENQVENLAEHLDCAMARLQDNLMEKLKEFELVALMVGCSEKQTVELMEY